MYSGYGRLARGAVLLLLLTGCGGGAGTSGAVSVSAEQPSGEERPGSPGAAAESSAASEGAVASEPTGYQQVAIYYPSVFGTEVRQTDTFCPQAVLMVQYSNGRLVETFPDGGTVQVIGENGFIGEEVPLVNGLEGTGCMNTEAGPTAALSLSDLDPGYYAVRFSFGETVYYGKIKLTP